MDNLKQLIFFVDEIAHYINMMVVSIKIFYFLTNSRKFSTFKERHREVASLHLVRKRKDRSKSIFRNMKNVTLRSPNEQTKIVP